jgi:hypothetical protein
MLPRWYGGITVRGLGGRNRGFKAATGHDSTKGESWVWLGRAYLGAGRTEDFSAAWDKALGLGTSVSVDLCRQRGIAWCERGTLLLDARKISFAGKSQLFSATPSEVTAHGFERDTATMPVSFFKLIPCWPVARLCQPQQSSNRFVDFVMVILHVRRCSTILHSDGDGNGRSPEPDDHVHLNGAIDPSRPPQLPDRPGSLPGGIFRFHQTESFPVGFLLERRLL